MKSLTVRFSSSPVPLHDVDDVVDVFNARTILIESPGPLWMYGTAAEHSVLYQYHFVNAKNVFIAQAQTESAYFQNNPPAPQPFTSLTEWFDPTFDQCSPSDIGCAKGWAIDIINGTNMYIYNAGLYSFFQTWSTSCIGTALDRYCQDGIYRVQGDAQTIYLYNLETIGVQNMVEINDQSRVTSRANIGVFSDGILNYAPTA